MHAKVKMQANRHAEVNNEGNRHTEIKNEGNIHTEMNKQRQQKYRDKKTRVTDIHR